MRSFCCSNFPHRNVGPQFTRNTNKFYNADLVIVIFTEGGVKVMNRTIFLRKAGLSCAAIAMLSTCEQDQVAEPELSFEESIQQQLIQAKPGDVIEIPSGLHELTRSLSLNVSGVTIQGAGKDESILSFKNQIQGAEGLLVNADDFTIQDLAIEDTVGDALKINESNNVIVKNVRTEWTGGALTTNGAYGIYPVQSTNVLIDGAVAIGASDAGIYVGQSSQIIVRNSHAEFNVAGIEIENSTFADVYNNVATNNTGGILVFDLPNLPVQGGKNTRVFNNEIINNNTPNFAPEGNIVGTVPAGSGLMILANDNIEIFDNDFNDNDSSNIMIVSYYITDRPFDDPDYDPFPESIYIHGNSFEGGGANPDSEPLIALKSATGAPIPDVVWDGTMMPDKQPNEILCLQENNDLTFVNLDASNGFASPNFYTDAHDCVLAPLNKISLTAVTE